jgi:hypothetical protein
MSPPSSNTVLAAPIFEGSEKRIEVDFRLGASAPANGLRAISRDVLDELMTLARCCIVSSRSNDQMDAYVLSESSLFVYPTKWILKTCGTTRLLNSVPRLLEVARALGLEPRRCKYTRASFLFPDNQVGQGSGTGDLLCQVGRREAPTCRCAEGRPRILIDVISKCFCALLLMREWRPAWGCRSQGWEQSRPGAPFGVSFVGDGWGPMGGYGHLCKDMGPAPLAVVVG